MTTVASLLAKFEGDVSGLQAAGRAAEQVIKSADSTFASANTAVTFSGSIAPLQAAVQQASQLAQSASNIKPPPTQFTGNAGQLSSTTSSVQQLLNNHRQQNSVVGTTFTGNAAPLVSAAHEAEQAVSGVGLSFTRVIEQAAGFGLAMAGLQGIMGVFNTVKQGAFGMNATLETSTLQFTILMGNADAAKAHVIDLFQIAKETPFETGPIIQASRTLQTFGGAALNTHDNIIMIGDAAAGANAGIQEVAFWVSRAYSMIQGGQPFGEAAMRLQELAILTPKARQEMENLQKTGASTTKVWEVLQAELKRFEGSMKLQAGTWQGVTSTFEDTKNILISTVFRPLFEAARDTLGRLNDFLGTDDVEAWAEKMQAMVTVTIGALGVMGEAFGTIFGSIASVVITIGQTIYEAMSYLNPFAPHSPPLVDQVKEGLDLILSKYETLREIEDPLRAVEGAIKNFEAVSHDSMAKIEQQTLDQKMITLSYLSNELPAAYGDAIYAIQQLNATLADLRTQITDQRQVIADLKPAMDAATLAVKEQEQAIHKLEEAARPLKDAVTAAQLAERPFADATKAAKDELADFQNMMKDVEAGFQGLEDAVTAASRAVSNQQMVVGNAEAALKPFQDRIAEIERGSSKLSDQLGQVKEKINDLTKIPVEGSKAYSDAIKGVERNIDIVNLKINQFHLAGITSGHGIENLQKTLGLLQAQAENLHLREKLDLGPKRDAISEALNPKPAEQSYTSLIDQALNLGKQQKPLEDSIKAQNQLKRDAVAAAEPYQTSLRNEQEVLSGLNRQREVANNALTIAKDKIMPDLLIKQRALETAVRMHEQAQRPATKAVEDANRALSDYNTYTVGPAQRDLEVLKDTETDLRTGWDAESKKLSELEGAYAGVKGQVDQWAKSLEDVLTAAQKVRTEAETAAKKTGANKPTIPDNPKLDPAAAAGAAAKLKEQQDLMETNVANIKTQWAPLLTDINNFRDGSKEFAAAIGTVNGPISAFGGYVNGLAEAEPGLHGIDLALAAMSLTVREFAGSDAGKQFDTVTQAIGDTAGAMGELLDKLGGADKVLEAVGIGLAAMLVAGEVAGPLLALVGIVGQVTLAFGAEGAAGALGLLVTALGGPVTLAILAIGIVMAGVALAWLNDWGDIKEHTADAIRLVTGLLAGYYHFLVGLADDIGSLLQGMGKAMVAGVEGVGGPVADAARAVGGALQTVGKGIIDTATTVDKTVDTAETALLGLADTINLSDKTFETRLGNIEATFDEYGNVSEDTQATVLAAFAPDRAQEALTRLQGVYDNGWKEQEYAASVAGVAAAAAAQDQLDTTGRFITNLGLQFDTLGNLTEDSKRTLINSVPADELDTKLTEITTYWQEETAKQLAAAADLATNIVPPMDTVGETLDTAGQNVVDYHTLTEDQLNQINDAWGAGTAEQLMTMQDYEKNLQTPIGDVGTDLDGSAADFKNYAGDVDTHTKAAATTVRTVFGGMETDTHTTLGATTQDIGGFAMGIGPEVEKGVPRASVAGAMIGTAISGSIKSSTDDGMPTVFTTIANWFATNTPDFLRIAKDVGDWGHGIGDAMLHGIQDASDAGHAELMKHLGQNADQIPGVFNQKLESHSPSLRMRREVGIPIIEGIIVGIKDRAEAARKAAADAADLIMSGFDKMKLPVKIPAPVVDAVDPNKHGGLADLANKTAEPFAKIHSTLAAATATTVDNYKQGGLADLMKTTEPYYVQSLGRMEEAGGSLADAAEAQSARVDGAWGGMNKSVDYLKQWNEQAGIAADTDPFEKMNAARAANEDPFQKMNAGRAAATATAATAPPFVQGPGAIDPFFGPAQTAAQRASVNAAFEKGAAAAAAGAASVPELPAAVPVTLAPITGGGGVGGGAPSNDTRGSYYSAGAGQMVKSGISRSNPEGYFQEQMLDALKSAGMQVTIDARGATFSNQDDVDKALNGFESRFGGILRGRYQINGGKQ